MKCPKCGNEVEFVVKVIGETVLFEDEFDEITDCVIDTDESVICEECGYQGAYDEFESVATLNETEIKTVVGSICKKLNELYDGGDFDNNEKIVAVSEIVKSYISCIKHCREEFFTIFSEMVENECNESINNDYGFYEGLIVVMCGGVK
jgi:predicted nucleic-acid-binding Zn-ribbon protein